MNNEAVVEESISKPKSSKLKISMIIGMLVVLICGYMVYSFNNNYMYNGKIANNIFVEDVNISLMTKEEAIALVSQNYKTEDLSLTYNGKTFKILPEDIDLKYNVEEVVNSAYNYTKRTHILKM